MKTTVKKYFVAYTSGSVRARIIGVFLAIIGIIGYIILFRHAALSTAESSSAVLNVALGMLLEISCLMVLVGTYPFVQRYGPQTNFYTGAVALNFF